MPDQDAAPPFSPDKPSLWPLGVLAILFLAFVFRAAPLSLDPVRTTNADTQFDTARAIDRLTRIIADGEPHPTDSDALDASRARLLAEIEALGYAPTVHDQTACRGSISGSAIRCARVQNITFTAGPETGPATLLTAHYDSVDASPGAGDDGIGVAVWLEVAHLLKQQPPAAPVLFLLSDGEETALLGAQAFIDAKAYGAEIGRIINLEARGVRGPAMMFETSHPNSALVADWAKNGARPFSNSMMTAIYELLPNSTDLTVHLQAGYPGVNIAISDGLDFYHTQRDDLAMLDRRSVQHMGDQALGATRAFIAASLDASAAPAGEAAYADIASRVFVILPQFLALVLLGLCFGVSAMLVLRPARIWDWKVFDWRAFILPPALIVSSGLAAFALQALIGLIRPEPAFWIAHPQALNCAIFLAALLLAAAGLAFLAPTSRRETLFATGWFWFLVIGMGLSFVIPGASLIFLMPGLVFVLAAVVARYLPKYLIAAHAAAAVFLALIFLPLIHLVDVTMGLGLAALFGVLEAMTLAPILSVIGPIAAGRQLVLSTVGASLAAAAIAAAIVPAFSLDRPLALNFTAHYDIDARDAQLVASAPPGALPKAVRDQLSVNAADILPGVSAALASRKLAFDPRAPANLIVESDTLTAGVRTLRLRLSAPGARQVRLRIPSAANPASLQRDAAAPIRMTAPQSGEPMSGYYIFDCVGRACDGARLTVTLNGATALKPLVWIVQGYWSGLPADAAPTRAARPETALQMQMGDVTITTVRAAP